MIGVLTTSGSNAVKVGRNRGPSRAAYPWLVTCQLCSSHTGFFGALWAKIIGWSFEWPLAIEFAARHAAAHEATRCTSCLHLPERELSPEEAASVWPR